MGPISCDRAYGSYGIDFDNGAKPVGTASFGLDLRCGLLPNECPNEERRVRIFPFSVLHLTFDLCALGVLRVRPSSSRGERGVRRGGSVHGQRDSPSTSLKTGVD